MELKRLSINLFAILAAVAIVGVSNDAQAGLFGCNDTCKAKKLAKAQEKAAQTGQIQYVNGVAVYPPNMAPAVAPQPAQPQAYTQPQAYPQTYGPVAQPNPYPQPQPQTYPPQPTYPQQPTYGTYSTQGYGGYTYTSQYVQLTTNDWTQYAQNYGYVPTPVMGAAYDKTPYPVSVNEPELQAFIKGAISTGGDADVGSAVVSGALVNKFYVLRGYQPAFVTSQGPSQQARVIRDIMTSKVVMKGLDPRDYWSNEMESRFNNAQSTPAQKAGLDLLMVQSLVRLAGDLSNGRSDPKNIDSYFMIKKRAFTDFQALNNSIRDGVDALAAIESFEPQHPEYKALEQSLPALYAIKSQGGYLQLAGTQNLKPGISSPDVPLLRQRLIDMNILPSYNASTSLVYDATLAQAVRQFQFDNKLKSDGIIGRQGFAVLNTSIDYRIMEIRATLEKWRFLPRSLGNRYIFINIARQEMQLFENGRVVMAMKTVNGKVLRPTNILVDQIVSVDLNPYWNPPPSLIIADIQKQQRDDPEHMTTDRVKIFGEGGVEVDPHTVDWKRYINTVAPYQFREEPGITNSLGVVKFQTTNSSAIYMHDTNHREFFDDFDERFISSGCIRLQRPLDLLQYLLRNNPQYGYQQLDAILNNPAQYTHYVVELKNDAIPFYVFYGTASFDENGKLRFARDAYSLDDRIVRAMTPMNDDN